MGLLLILTVAVGIGIGYALAYTTGSIARLKSADRKKMVHTQKNLNVAESALRRIANPVTGNPALEADIALEEINNNNFTYLEGR